MNVARIITAAALAICLGCTRDETGPSPDLHATFPFLPADSTELADRLTADGAVLFTSSKATRLVADNDMDIELHSDGSLVLNLFQDAVVSFRGTYEIVATGDDARLCMDLAYGNDDSRVQRRRMFLGRDARGLLLLPPRDELERLDHDMADFWPLAEIPLSGRFNPQWE